MIVKLCKILVSPGCSSCVWWLDIQLVSVLGVTPCHAATHFIHVLSETKLLDTINNIATKYLQCICIVSWLSWWHSTLLLQHHCQCWISSVKHVSSFPKFFRNIFTTNERWQLKCVFNFWEIPGWHSQKFEANNFNFDCSNSALVGQTHPSYDGSILVKPPPPPPQPLTVLFPELCRQVGAELVDTLRQYPQLLHLLSMTATTKYFSNPLPAGNQGKIVWSCAAARLQI